MWWWRVNGCILILKYFIKVMLLPVTSQCHLYFLHYALTNTFNLQTMWSRKKSMIITKQGHQLIKFRLRWGSQLLYIHPCNFTDFSTGWRSNLSRTWPMARLTFHTAVVPLRPPLSPALFQLSFWAPNLPASLHSCVRELSENLLHAWRASQSFLSGKCVRSGSERHLPWTAK